MKNDAFENEQKNINVANKGDEEMSKNKNENGVQTEFGKSRTRRETLMMKRAASGRAAERAMRRASNEKAARRDKIRADRSSAREERIRAKNDRHEFEEDKSATARKHYGNAMQKDSAGDLKGALKALNSAVSLCPDNIDFLFERSVILQKMSQYGAVMLTYDHIDRLISNRTKFDMAYIYRWRTKILFYRAETLMAMSRLGDAARCYSDLIHLVEKNGKDSNDYYQKALVAHCRLCLKSKRILTAFEDRKKLIDGMFKGTIKSSPEVWFYCGLSLELKNAKSTFGVYSDNSESIENYGMAIWLNPDYTEALFYRGNALFRARKYALAIADLERVLELDPTHADAATCLGDALFRSKRYDKALSMCEKATELNPDGKRNPDIIYVYGFIDPRRALAAICAEQERRNRNIKNQLRIIRLDNDAQVPDNEDDAGMDRKLNGDIDRCNEEIALDPMNVSAYSKLGDAWVGKGELEKASEIYQFASNLEQDNIVLLNKIAMVALFREQYEEVEKYCSKALFLDAKDKNAKDLMSEARRGVK